MNFEELVNQGLKWDEEDNDIFNSQHCWTKTNNKIIIYWNAEYKNKNNIQKRSFSPHRVVASRIINQEITSADWVKFKDNDVLNFKRKNLDISLDKDRKEERFKNKTLLYDDIDKDMFSELPIRFSGYGYAMTDIPKRLWTKYNVVQDSHNFHRLIGERIAGRKLLKEEKVDHINGNLQDLRRSNLRIVTHKENTENRTKININNTSGIRGVYFRKDVKKRPWQAQTMHYGKNKSLGTYATKEEAKQAVIKFRESNFKGSKEYRESNEVNAFRPIYFLLFSSK